MFVNDFFDQERIELDAQIGHGGEEQVEVSNFVVSQIAF